MPEYLSPGVYVEEVDTGSKPIEGVSTSTAGMVGATERGPVNVPILVTSYGEYRRWFGDLLDVTEFSNAAGRHCYLPFGVQGFFENGGKRVYVVRVLDTEGARPSSADAFDRGDPASPPTILLRSAAELTGTAANPPSIVVLDASTLAQDDWIRIGDGSRADYQQVDVPPQLEDMLVTLDLPLARSHEAGTPVVDFDPAANQIAAFTIVADVDARAQSVTLRGAIADINGLVAGSLLQIGAGATREHRFLAADPTGVRDVSATDREATVRLDSALLQPYPATTAVERLSEVPATQVAADSLATASTAGDVLVFVGNTAGSFVNATHLVMIQDADASRREVRRMGALTTVMLGGPVAEAYPPGSLVDEVGVADDTHNLNARAGALLTLADVTGLVAGESVVIDPASPGRQQGVIRQVDAVAGTIKLVAAPAAVPPLNVPVQPAPKALTAASAPGAAFIDLNDRMGLVVGTVVRVGDTATGEIVTIAAIPNRAPAGAAPDAGPARVEPALIAAHGPATEVVIQGAPTLAGSPTTVVVLAPAAGQAQLLVTDGAALAANDVIRVTTAAGAVAYHRITATAAPTPDRVTLRGALVSTHRAGSVVAERRPLFDIEALDPGAWGDRLRVSMSDESTGLVARTDLRQFGPPTRVRLGSVAGIEPGTVLEVRDPGAAEAIGSLLKVDAVNRTTGEITLAAPGIDGPQSAANAALAAGHRLMVRSREFSLTTRWLRRIDPSVPSRGETVIGEETFRHLSMDPRHSRYAETIIGQIAGTPRLADRRPEGESWYIRVHDLAQDLAEPQRTTALWGVRLGPEPLVDLLPDGRTRPARRPLAGGDDAIGTLTDLVYRGTDDPTPENRTGLQALRNIEQVSIVACPGRTTAQMQQDLIDHCELLRYRFAVLDAMAAPTDTLADIQTQRQQFDSRYAALYHPWLTLPTPFPVVQERDDGFGIPPSGHVAGVYARTDIERGVHKAPANEVVRGIVGLQRVLTKEQQDILNPYPVNVNVIRDFREDNRGIRVFGGRVVTSDPDWKYVNVRRLLIFIEASIDRGLQWVVFEPNAEPLWARVRRSITNFLVTVWRNGALEGVKPEEAFFVKCDRTTMTQTDIDNGRLIVLIGVAPVKPAEFVIIRIGLWTARAD